MTGRDTQMRFLDPATAVTLDMRGNLLNVIASTEAVLPLMGAGYRIAAAAGDVVNVDQLIARIRIDHSEPDTAMYLTGVIHILAEELGALIDRSVIGVPLRQALQQLADEYDPDHKEIPE
ncbi:hypothetical protein [Nakamurella lactea]|uniref:hypothetical protein n=1 Tax=Nakamurella lactea TaxID=459515 RepID=UPI0003F8EA1F|nr:hypothetical protein [Nakamurella lactea]